MSQNLTIFVEQTYSFASWVPFDNVYLKAFVVMTSAVFLSIFGWLVFKRILSLFVKSTKTTVDDELLHRSEIPVVLLVLLSGLFISGNVLGLGAVFGRNYARSYLTVISFLIFLIVYNSLIVLIQTGKKSISGSRLKLFDKKIYPLFEITMKIVIGVVYLFIFFGIWNIDLSPLLASAGILGVALAFAAKDTVANVFGGISLFLDRTYQIGDYIIIDDKDRGEVVDISLRSTKILTRDNIMVSIPNSVLSNSKVINETGIDPKMRIRLPISVAYDADLDKVEKVLLDVVTTADYVKDNPEPVVRYRSYGDFSVNLELLFWVAKPEDRGRDTHQMIKDIHGAFIKNKIDFPYPVRDIRFSDTLSLKK